MSEARALGVVVLVALAYAAFMEYGGDMAITASLVIIGYMVSREVQR